jgi:hypothetical protein
VLLAAAYMRLLLSVIRLAGLFNMSFMQALHRAGFDMLAQLAWQSVDTRTIIVYVLAAILGATCAVWRPSR